MTQTPPPPQDPYTPQDPYASQPSYTPPQQQYPPYYYPPQTQAESLKHSGMGVTSFIMSIFCGVTMFALMLTAGVMEASSPGGIDEDSPVSMILGLMILGIFFLCLVSGGLGVGSLFMPATKKMFGIMDIVISAMVMLLFILLMVVGLMMS